jgi:prephenate dehydratase
VFTLRRDESGALWRLLEPFARCGVNLTSIQIRPIEGKPWEYHFFLDVEGNPGDPRVREALDAAARVANSARVLGSFPRAARRDE